MAAGRIVIPSWMPALDSDGEPIPGARMFFYMNETTTLQTIYANEALTTPLPNPVSANSSGRFPDIWADDSKTYSVTVDAPYGPPGAPFTYDNIVAGSTGSGGGGSDAELREEVGAALAPYSLQNGALVDPSDMEALADRAYEDAMSRWWQTANGRIWGGDGGFALNNEEPLVWAKNNLHESIYYRAKAGDADAISKVQSNWAEMLARKGATLLGQASLANGIGASDDLSWDARYLTRVHDITGDAQVLTILRNLMIDGMTVFKDPDNNGAGLLYTTDANSAFLGHYRVTASNDVFTAMVALYLESKGAANPPGTTWRQFALDTYSAIKNHFIHPTGVLYVEVDVNPATPGTPKPVDSTPPTPIEPHYPPTTLAFTLGFAALCARLNAVAPSPQYITDINNVISAVLTVYKQRGDVLFPDRDGWGNGLGFPEFVSYVTSTLPGINQDNLDLIRQSIFNTAVAACSMRSAPYYYNRGVTWGEGLYGADWIGPLMGTNGILTWFQTANNTGNGPKIALPEQIMTAASTQSLIVSAWLLARQDVARVPTAQIVTFNDMRPVLQQMNEAFVPLLGGVTIRDFINVTAPIRRDNDFFMDIINTEPVLGFGANDYISYDRNNDVYRFKINGNDRYNVGDQSSGAYGDFFATGDSFLEREARIGRTSYFTGDPNFFVGRSGSGFNAVNFANQCLIQYNPSPSRYEIILGGVVVGTITSAGFVNGNPAGYTVPYRIPVSPGLIDVGYFTTSATAPGTMPANTTRSWTVSGINAATVLRFERVNQVLTEEGGTGGGSQISIYKNGTLQSTPLGQVAGATREFSVVNGDVVSFAATSLTSSNGALFRVEFDLKITTPETQTDLDLVHFNLKCGV